MLRSIRRSGRRCRRRPSGDVAVTGAPGATARMLQAGRAGAGSTGRPIAARRPLGEGGARRDQDGEPGLSGSSRTDAAFGTRFEEDELDTPRSLARCPLVPRCRDRRVRAEERDPGAGRRCVEPQEHRGAGETASWRSDNGDVPRPGRRAAEGVQGRAPARGRAAAVHHGTGRGGRRAPRRREHRAAPCASSVQRGTLATRRGPGGGLWRPSRRACGQRARRV